MYNLKNFKNLLITSTLGLVLVITIIVILQNSNWFDKKDENYIIGNAEINEASDISLSPEIILASYNKTENTRDQQVISRSSRSRESRNYIAVEQIEISKDMDLTKRCNISKEDFIDLMKNLKTDYSNFFEENASLIYDLCEKYELNEVFFCGIIAAESGWNIASNHRRTHNYISLMSSNGLIYFDSVESGLTGAAKALHENYLSENGKFYKGKTLEAVRKHFCPVNPGWSNLVYTCMQQVLK